MRVQQYYEFLSQTSQYRHLPQDEQTEISLYGLVGEIGSLVAAIKKQTLSEAGKKNWNYAGEEIIEELGDALWYCFYFTQAHNGSKFDLLKSDIKELRKRISAKDAQAQRITNALSMKKSKLFLDSSKSIPRKNNIKFDEYQEVAFLTARTQKKLLLTVCLSVLWQLAAELLRQQLPDSEKSINQNIADRDPNIILGEILWHLSAVATLFNTKLSEVIQHNVEKVSFRQVRGEWTPLHDRANEQHESFPSKMSVAFVTVERGKSQMYFDGKKFGDPLTDNSTDNDGYRFHDVMHLANLATLGWSPVLRKLLGKKRKSLPKVDEVEDGARAQIIEEAVVKTIHTEGQKAEKLRVSGRKNTLFLGPDEITFQFLKFIRDLVEGLEVWDNKYWEWESAILEGHRVFRELCAEEQGTVTVDLSKRRISFSPTVNLDVPGAVLGVGSSVVNQDDLIANDSDFDRVSAYHLSPSESLFFDKLKNKRCELAKFVAIKKAVLSAMNIQNPNQNHFRNIRVQIEKADNVGVTVLRDLREEKWRQGILYFRTTFSIFQTNVSCTSIALSDPS